MNRNQVDNKYNMSWERLLERTMDLHTYKRFMGC